MLMFILNGNKFQLDGMQQPAAAAAAALEALGIAAAAAAAAAMAFLSPARNMGWQIHMLYVEQCVCVCVLHLQHSVFGCVCCIFCLYRTFTMYKIVFSCRIHIIHTVAKDIHYTCIHICNSYNNNNTRNSHYIIESFVHTISLESLAAHTKKNEMFSRKFSVRDRQRIGTHTIYHYTSEN